MDAVRGSGVLFLGRHRPSPGSAGQVPPMSDLKPPDNIVMMWCPKCGQMPVYNVTSRCRCGGTLVELPYRLALKTQAETPRAVKSKPRQQTLWALLAWANAQCEWPAAPKDLVAALSCEGVAPEETISGKLVIPDRLRAQLHSFRKLRSDVRLTLAKRFLQEHLTTQDVRVPGEKQG
jgi:hypothetical protein